jgi:hypothetical protein
VRIRSALVYRTNAVKRSTESSLAVACLLIEADGSLASPASSYPRACSRDCFGDGSTKNWQQRMTAVNCGSSVNAPRLLIQQCSPSGLPLATDASHTLKYSSF